MASTDPHDRPPIACNSTATETSQHAPFGSGCRLEQAVRADLDHDGNADCLIWMRCGPDEPSGLIDGGLSYPVDSLTLTLQNGTRSWELYSNHDAVQSERLENLTTIRFDDRDERVVTRATSYGTGNMQVWAVVDIFQGARRRWSEPSLDAVSKLLLGPGERVGKHYEHGVQVNSGNIDVAHLVYRNSDPNCCPTGGLIKVRLTTGTNGLRVERAWREADR